jgi:hypothetical protein
MIVSRRGAARTTVRQAIIAHYEPSARFPELACPVALDVAASLGAVNGFSLAFVCTDQPAAKEIAPLLPVGVDLRLHTPVIDQPTAIFFAREYAEHRFERMVFVAADTLGLTARIISTASSVLADASPVLGLTATKLPYLVGVNDAALGAGDPDTLTALAEISNLGSPTSQRGRLDRLSRLFDFNDRSELETFVRESPKVLPRMHQRLLELAQ